MFQKKLHGRGIDHRDVFFFNYNSKKGNLFVRNSPSLGFGLKKFGANKKPYSF